MREERENKGRKEGKKELENHLFPIIKTRSVYSLTHTLSKKKTYYQEGNHYLDDQISYREHLYFV